MVAKSTKYYRSNPEARKRKAKTDKKVNSRPEQVKKRVESNKARRKAKKNGQNVKGKDYDHAVRKFVKTKTNRGRKGEGGRKRKSKRKFKK